jgi:hypothetical protein
MQNLNIELTRNLSFLLYAYYLYTSAYSIIKNNYRLSDLIFAHKILSGHNNGIYSLSNLHLSIWEINFLESVRRCTQTTRTLNTTRWTNRSPRAKHPHKDAS